MPELRWTLLALGALFIAALAWWELRKPRHAQRGQSQRAEGDRRPPLAAPGDLKIDPAARVYREPTISFPDIRPRDPVPDLPVIEMKDDSLIGLRLDGQRIEDAAAAAKSEEVLEPPAVLPSEREPESALSRGSHWEIEREVAWSDENASPEQPVEADLAADSETASAEPPPVIPHEPEPEVHAEERLAALDVPWLTEPVVDWPEESQRKIIALRLVSPVDRFPGRALRQALSAEGFLLGKFAIYHKAGADGRAVVSAASLTRPGTFDAEAIDMQRFGGLNLFAVLPGPLSAHSAFDELLATARNLNERLQGGLQDDKGQPLTPARIAAIRATLDETPPSIEPTA